MTARKIIQFTKILNFNIYEMLTYKLRESDSNVIMFIISPNIYEFNMS